MKHDFLLLTAAVIFAAGGAFACSPSKPKPFSMSYKTFKKTFPDCQQGSCVVVEIDGLTTAASTAGDSCAAAAILPEGFRLASFNVINAENGDKIGFGDFAASEAATRGFCYPATNCTGVSATVGKEGVKAGIPVTLSFEFTTEKDLNGQDLLRFSRTMVTDGLFAAGGMEPDGAPHHHAAVMRPHVVEIRFDE